MNAEELMLLNCDVWEDSWESLGLQGDQTHQPGIFIGRPDAEAETLILWPPDAKSWSIRKDPDAGKDWMQEKRMSEDEVVGWYHWLNGHEFEQSGRGWSTVKPGMMQSMESQRVWHDWVT